jgi:hypothetical protein
MNVHDLAAARALRPDRPADHHRTAAGSPSFGKVYEIETARRARSARLADSVREEMDAAARLYETLRAEDRQVRFHTGLDGRVVASLCDLDGTFLAPLKLADVVALDVDADPPLPAA